MCDLRSPLRQPASPLLHVGRDSAGRFAHVKGVPPSLCDGLQRATQFRQPDISPVRGRASVQQKLVPGGGIVSAWGRPAANADAMIGETGYPSIACPMAGARTSERPIAPHSSMSVLHPSTPPVQSRRKANDLGCGYIPSPEAPPGPPRPGHARWRFSAECFCPCAPDQREQVPAIPVTSAPPHSAPPPPPLLHPRHFPPFISICRPPSAAKGWLVATIPWVARTGERWEFELQRFHPPGCVFSGRCTWLP